MTHSEAEFNRKVFSSDFAVQLARQAPAPPGEPIKDGEVEATSSASSTLSPESNRIINRILSESFTRTKVSEDEDSTDEDKPQQPTRRALRGSVKEQPIDELTELVKRYDPEGKLKLLVQLTMLDIQEAVRVPYGADPYELIKYVSLDPGIDEEDVKTLKKFADNLLQNPKRRRH
jgi:hypothetical protein